MAKKKTATSAKDINIYKTADYAPQTTKSAEKALQYMTNLTNAKTFKFNAEQADLTRKFNHDEAKIARDWQTDMSNTAHQREVADLKKAGLNPVLSANTGAQSYSTSAASAQNASAAAQSAATAVSGYAQSVLSSNATRYAARESASAMRYSAQMNYAASLEQANAARYGYELGYKNNQEQRAHDTWSKQWQSGENLKDRESKERQTQYQSDRSLFGFLTHVADLAVSTLTGRDVKTGQKVYSGLGDKVSGVWNAIENGFKKAANFTGVANYWKTTNSQKADLGRILMAIDMNNTSYNQSMLLRAFSGDKKAQSYIYRHKKKNRSGKF